MTPNREPEKIILPPFVYEQEREKIAERLPAAIRFVEEHALNGFPGSLRLGGGIITCGGSYNTVIALCSGRVWRMSMVTPISPSIVSTLPTADSK